MPNFNATFWKWFGDSKVADDGHPLVVYHGSVNSQFTVFDPAAKAVRTRTGPAGVYFTSDIQSAYNYVFDKTTKKRGTVFACYLSLQNPLDITKDILKLRKRKLSFGDAKRQALEKLTPDHDGVIFWGDGWNTDEFVAFYPEQIKLVTNDGTWDADDPDIRSNPIKKKAQVPVGDVIENIEETDGTGDLSWVADLIKTVSDFDIWFLGPIKISDIQNDNTSDEGDLIDGYAPGIENAPPVVLVPHNGSRKWFVTDGSHRTATLELLGRKTVMAYYPKVDR